MGIINEMAKQMMEEQKDLFSKEDMEALDVFLGRVLDAYHSGEIERKASIEAIADLIVGIEGRDMNVFNRWVYRPYPVVAED